MTPIVIFGYRLVHALRGHATRPCWVCDRGTIMHAAKRDAFRPG